MEIKHIFTDMDGTLLNRGGQLSQETITCLQELAIPVTLVSARAPMEMDFAIKALGLTDIQIAFNSGLLFQNTASGRQLLAESPIDFDLASRIIYLLKCYFPQLSISWYDAENWYSCRIDDGTRFESGLTGLLPTVTEKLASVDRKIFKIMLITFDEIMMQQLNNFLTELAIPGITIQRSGGFYLEITAAAAMKSTGIRYIMTKEALVPAETAAFGDGLNDIPMLREVGLPIVMDNAYPEVKAHGRYITLPNTEDGVAHGIRRYILNQKPAAAGR